MNRICSIFLLSLASTVTFADPPTLLPHIDLNKAAVSDLTHVIKGLGEKRAKAIVAYREAHGEFKSVDELASVPGFGAFAKHHMEELNQHFIIFAQARK